MEQEFNKLTEIIIGAAIEVHRLLGPGLLEKYYGYALTYELTKRGLDVKTEVRVPFIYKELYIQDAARIDILVEDKIIIELKATEMDNDLFSRQILTYLKLSGKKLGLLINFKRKFVKDGITRVINGSL